MEGNRERHRINHPSRGKDSGSLGARLIICVVLCALMVLVKSAFPRAAEAASRWLLGDGSYKEAFSQLTEPGQTSVEAFKSLVLGGSHED